LCPDEPDLGSPGLVDEYRLVHEPVALGDGSVFRIYRPATA
jgi:hypothetical protein